MKRKANSKSNVIVPGGVDEYIEKCPKGVQTQLRDIRIAIQGAAPGSTETVSYFQMPGYFYEDPRYDYNGMFAWFSFKAPYVRLHVRPPVLENHKKDLGDYATAKAIISFAVDKAIPKALVKKLVKASIKVMKQKPRHTPAPKVSHVAAGQKKPRPHEAWHVVQQSRGRVKSTIQMKDAPVDDDGGLEREADAMGRRATKRSPLRIDPTRPTPK